MGCTPERGSRQMWCLIYRLEGILKLFLPDGLEHMGVTLRVKAILQFTKLCLGNVAEIILTSLHLLDAFC